jgi:DNA-binding transcriptional regulator YiaG
METKGAALMRLFRERTGMSQREVSRQCGVAPTLCRDWEMGARRPSEETAARISVFTNGAVPASSWREPVQAAIPTTEPPHAA